jgi:TatD DNase family protein
MLIDTHSHLYLEDFDDDREEVIHRALESDIKKLLLPNIDAGTIERLSKMVNDYPGICYSMMGLHPGSVKENYEEELDIIYNSLKRGKHIGVGEIGIDLYWDKSFQKEQEVVFEKQLIWAKEFNLPVVIHSRDSFDEIFQVMDKVFNNDLRGVFHSFTGSKRELEKIKDYDFYIGINGISTFKNSELKEILPLIPENRLLLETDSPFLAPVPRRGRRNESSYLRFINEFIAGYLSVPVEKMEEKTTRNAVELFKI